jgi:diaminohydroxyphosphoribosylaminopyrimidine deaminase/5-amino-6-(5-phosphoribosylamino)uracil reductase
LKESTLYVNLEPCAHKGKTPPCSNLIVTERIPRVVIGTPDPNMMVEGKGIQMMKDAGIDVTTNVLADECRELNRRFFTYHEKKRPYILLKWAQTSDGFMDTLREPGEPVGPNWISNPLSRTLVHRWRAEEQGIMAGTNTVLTDNPELTVRYYNGNSPLRIIPDRNLRIPSTYNIFNKTSKTLVFNGSKSGRSGNIEYIQIDFNENALQQIMGTLYKKQILSVMVEGGKKMIESLLHENLWDEARILIGKKEFEQGLKAPLIDREPIKTEQLLDDTIIIYRNNPIS